MQCDANVTGIGTQTTRVTRIALLLFCTGELIEDSVNIAVVSQFPIGSVISSSVWTCPKILYTKISDKMEYANSADQDQTLHCCHFTKYSNKNNCI